MFQGLDKIANTPPSFLLEAEIFGLKISLAILLVAFFALTALAVYNYEKKGFWKGFFGIDPSDKNVGGSRADIAALIFIAVACFFVFGFFGWLVRYSQHSILFYSARNYIFVFSAVTIPLLLLLSVILTKRFFGIFGKASFGRKIIVCLTFFFGLLLSALFILSFFVLNHVIKHF